MDQGRFFRELRIQSGMTINDVVKEAQGILDKTTISRIERGERGVSLKAAYALSQVFKINLSELCEMIVGKKLHIKHVPFETSPDERKLLEDYRMLSKPRRRTVHEFMRGMALTGKGASSTQLRKQLLSSLKEPK